jgi:P27 family predicted phage terminase small subunit
MRGRKPKPSRLKQLAGNPGKRPLPKAEARLRVAIPPMPSHLLGEARREWKRISQLLFDAGLVTQVDRGALAAYCQSWARWVKAEREIKKKSEVVYGIHGTLKTNPWVGVSRGALEEMRKFLLEFGLTPSSRSRVRAAEMEQMSLADLLFAPAEKPKP